MTVSQLSGLEWGTYQFISNSAYSGQLSNDTSTMQKQMGVENLGSALSLPTQTGNLGTITNLDAYVAGLYTQSQLPQYQQVSDIGKTSKTALSGIGSVDSYAKSLYTANRLGLSATSAADLNSVTMASQSAQITRLQSLLQSSPATVVQLYQNYLSDSFPGAVFNSVA